MGETVLRSDLEASPFVLRDAKNIAIIMDGNGRWASAHGLSVAEGHRAGSRALRPVVETAIDLGVESLAVYAFSTENWTRSARRGRGPDGDLRRDDRPRARGPRRAGRAHPLRRSSRPRAGVAPGEDGRARGCDRGPRSPQPLDRLRLRRTRRARRGGAPTRGERHRARGRGRGGDRAQPLRNRPCPIPTSSSAPPASCESPTSSSGSPPTRSTSSPRRSGRTSAHRSCAPRSRSTRAGAVDSVAASSPGAARRMGASAAMGELA